MPDKPFIVLEAGKYTKWRSHDGLTSVTETGVTPKAWFKHIVYRSGPPPRCIYYGKSKFVRHACEGS